MYDIHIHITRRHNIHLSRAQIANIYLFVTRVFINDNRFNRRIMIPGMMASVMLYDERESAVNNGQWRIKYDTWSSCQTPSSDNEWRFVNVVTQGNERGDANEPKTTTDVRFREVKRYIKKKYMEAIVLSPPSSHHACACMRYNYHASQQPKLPDAGVHLLVKCNSVKFCNWSIFMALIWSSDISASLRWRKRKLWNDDNEAWLDDVADIVDILLIASGMSRIKPFTSKWQTDDERPWCAAKVDSKS